MAALGAAAGNLGSSHDAAPLEVLDLNRICVLR